MRNCYIDNIRGIATISVVYIHTVFWSGEYYVPEILRCFALFIDVPIFFLLTGMTFAYTKKLNPIKQIMKLIIYFSSTVIFLQLIFDDFNLNNIFNALTMNNAVFDLFPVISGSYWFVPIYAVSMILAYGLILEFNKFSVIFIVLSFLYYIVSYFFGYSLEKYNFLGINLNYLLFYTSCILVGYHAYKYQGNKRCAILALISFVFFLVLYIYDNNALYLQQSKFPVRLPYVVVSSISLSIILFVNNLNYKI